MNERNEQPAPTAKFNEKVRRANAATALGVLLGMSRGNPSGTAPLNGMEPADFQAQRAEEFMRVQGGVALGIYLGDYMAAYVMQGGKTDARELGRMVTAHIEDLYDDMYCALTDIR